MRMKTNNMSTTLDVFAQPVVYKHKTRVCSLSTLIVASSIALTIIAPLIIVHRAGGFWLRNRVYVETPVVYFAKKYFLVAENANFPTKTIVCSTFTTYKNNPISDDCTIVKVREVDVNKDRRKDVFKFEARFYSDRPVRSLTLLLFFRIELKELINASVETIAALDYTLTRETQNVSFIGDLKLRQKTLLRIDHFRQDYNYSVAEIGDKSLSEILRVENARNKLSARLSNTRVTSQTGFSSEEPIVVSGEIFYSEQRINYQAGFWEEIKWAWMQYLSIFIAVIHPTVRVLGYCFTNGYLKSYTLVPWKEK